MFHDGILLFLTLLLLAIQGRFSIPKESQYSDSIHQLIREMLHVSPQSRPSASAVLSKVCTLLNRPVPNTPHCERQQKQLQLNNPLDIHMASTVELGSGTHVVSIVIVVVGIVDALTPLCCLSSDGVLPVCE